MIGEKHFATCENLRALMDAVLSLASECTVLTQENRDAPTDSGDSTARRQWMEELLTKPIVFLACGEINAGKSTLLNTLAGQEICKADPLPQLGPIRWHKYGAIRHESIAAEGVISCSAPVPFLQYFQLIDTPGTNSGDRSVLATVTQMISMVDLVFVVFPVSNPWGAPTWDFLSKQKPEMLNKVVFILQQCDQRDEADVPVLLGHLRDLSMKRLGKTPAVFPISAPLARSAHHKRSGMDAFENHLSKCVMESPQRRDSLRKVHRVLADVLLTIEENIEGHKRKLEEHGKILDDVERNMECMRADTLRRQTKSLGGIGEVFQCEARNAADVLSKRLSVKKSITRLFTGEDTAYAAESLIQPHLLKALEEVAGSDLQMLIHRCCEHWIPLRDRLNLAIGVKIDNVEITRNRLNQSAEDFVKRMGKASAGAVGDLRLRGTLDASLRSRNAGMSTIMGLTLILIICAGWCGGIGWTGAAITLSAIAACVFIHLVFVTMQSRREIVEEFGNRLVNHSHSFVAAMRGDYEEGLRIFFREYGQGLESVRRHLAAEKSALQPRMRKSNSLFLALKAIEQEIN